MPVDTGSDRWKGAEPENSSREDILNFLESNSHQAFSAEEVSEEIFDTGFELDIPQEEGPVEEMLGIGLGSTHYKAYLEAFTNSHLSALVYSGDVEVRRITEDLEDGEMEVAYYTASRE